MCLLFSTKNLVCISRLPLCAICHNHLLFMLLITLIICGEAKPVNYEAPYMIFSSLLPLVPTNIISTLFFLRHLKCDTTPFI
jgi:hypothetical protein